MIHIHALHDAQLLIKSLIPADPEIDLPELDLCYTARGCAVRFGQDKDGVYFQHVTSLPGDPIQDQYTERFADADAAARRLYHDRSQWNLHVTPPQPPVQA